MVRRYDGESAAFVARVDYLRSVGELQSAGAADRVAVAGAGFDLGSVG